MHPLDSTKLKTHRANIHINALKKSIRHSFNPQHAVREKAISQGPLQGLSIIHVDIDPTAKAESWGLIIGDIVTNLRDALDHIAWALAMKYIRETDRKKLTVKEAKTVQFPLYDEISAMNDPRRGVRALQFVLPRAHSEIKRFQPYNRKDWPELNLLRDLEVLANTDKHRLVTPSKVLAHIRMNEDDPGIIAHLNDKSNRMFLNPGEHLEPNITYEIVVYPRDAFHPMNIDVLPLIHNFIRDEVIPAFTCFF
jgi:hypothetical protein